MAPFAALPAELLRRLAVFLPVDSLKTCRLVSRALNEACEPELFKKLVVYADMESFAKANAVADHEQLRLHVRVIKYSGRMVFYRRRWVMDLDAWLDEGVMRGDDAWRKLAPILGKWPDYTKPPLATRPVENDELYEIHLSYRDWVSTSQASALRPDVDLDFFKRIMSRCHKTDSLIFDAGWAHRPPGPGDAVFDKTLIGRSAYGGYKRHTRQMLVLLAAAEDLLPELKSFTAVGIDHASLHHILEPRIFQAWERVQNLTVRFQDSAPNFSPISCHNESWVLFRGMLDRITALKSFSLRMVGPVSYLENIFTPLHKKALQYKNKATSGFEKPSSEAMEALPEHTQYPALEYLYLDGMQGTAEQWEALLDGVYKSGKLNMLELHGCFNVTGFDIDARQKYCQLTGQGNDYTWSREDCQSAPQILRNPDRDDHVGAGWCILAPDDLCQEAYARRAQHIPMPQDPNIVFADEEESAEFLDFMLSTLPPGAQVDAEDPAEGAEHLGGQAPLFATYAENEIDVHGYIDVDIESEEDSDHDESSFSDEDDVHDELSNGDED